MKMVFQDNYPNGTLFARLDRAEQGVLKDPVEQKGRRVAEEIRHLKLRRQLGRPRSPGGQANGTRGDIVAESLEPRLGPGPHVVAGPATRDADCAAR